jgi:hypothetical protein
VDWIAILLQATVAGVILFWAVRALRTGHPHASPRALLLAAFFSVIGGIGIALLWPLGRPTPLPLILAGCAGFVAIFATSQSDPVAAKLTATLLSALTATALTINLLIA